GDHEDSLKEYAQKIGVSDKVEFLGFVSEKKKWELLQKAWVFLMPSIKEGWGITSIEAASCGTPQVGFNVPGVRDAIRNNITGFLSHNKEEYINDIKRLIEDKELRDVMSKGGIEWAKVFTWEKSVDIYENIFDSLVTD